MKTKATTPLMPGRKNAYLRKPVCITLHPLILARVDSRNGNRSEQINADLARIYLIEDGKADMLPEERRRLKALGLIREIQEEHEKPIDDQETDTNRKNQPPPTPTSSRPDLNSPRVMITSSETEHEFESLDVERLLALLETHPVQAELLTLGLALKLADRYASKRDKYEVAQV